MNKQTHSKEWYEAERLAGLWLYRANMAAEKGDTALEERHLERCQKWLDKLNIMDNLASKPQKDEHVRPAAE